VCNHPAKPVFFVSLTASGPNDRWKHKKKIFDGKSCLLVKEGCLSQKIQIAIYKRIIKKDN